MINLIANAEKKKKKSTVFKERPMPKEKGGEGSQLKIDPFTKRELPKSREVTEGRTFTSF